MHIHLIKAFTFAHSHSIRHNTTHAIKTHTNQSHGIIKLIRIYHYTSFIKQDKGPFVSELFFIFILKTLLHKRENGGGLAKVEEIFL